MITKKSSPESIGDFNNGEVILIDKPRGYTSFDIVKKVRKAYPGYVKKIGHAGTLDPMATGLLILCCGKMTKQIQEFQNKAKTYQGTMMLGGETASFDADTEITQTFDTDHLTEASLKAIAQNFIGSIEQVPPQYSAVKVEGKRAYDSARKGEKVQIDAKTVNVYDFQLTSINLPEVTFKVQCSKGTFIRSIARDFGQALNNGGYLTSLRRTAIGDYQVEDALALEAIQALFVDAKTNIDV